jgi:hypothetical protein
MERASVTTPSIRWVVCFSQASYPMTVAICIHCGARKVGAFTPCAACGFDPDQPEDRAKALLLSDRHLTTEELDHVSSRIQGGTPPQFDEESLTQLTAELSKVDWRKEERSVAAFIWGCFVVAALLVVGGVYLLLRFR